MSAASPDALMEQLAGPPPVGREEEARVVAAVRAYLEAVRAELESLLLETRSGRAVNERHSDRMDRLVRRLFDLAESEYFREGHTERDDLAVVAVGGYARREMALHSDVDLLLLHAGRISPYVTRIAERMQYWLWDAGVTVGCATRSVDETTALMRRDETAFTAVLDTRFLSGEATLHQRLSDAVRREVRRNPVRFIEGRLETLRGRDLRYGESLYLLQPNVKEGAGGLRDYHSAFWAARAVHDSMRRVTDLLDLGLLTEGELDEYARALDFLWLVRNQLHRVTGRRTDQLGFEHQERIAAELGYGEAGDAQDVALPVERFMGDYYRHARAVRSHSLVVIEQCLARARPPRRRRPRPRRVEDGFRLVEGRLEIPHGAYLRERPVRLLTAFAVAQEHDAELTRGATRLVRENLNLVDDALRRDPEAAAAFLRILDAEHRVARTLVVMNEVGLLGRYLPEWEHIFCRWQHVMYHTYTVDTHSIFLVEHLRRLWKGEYADDVPDLTELIRQHDDRVVLYLGCLLHDVGKGLGGNHSERGAERAAACVERLGLEPVRAARVVFLVRHHLIMSHVAQRRDLSDPKMILDFARLVGDRTNLRNLYLLTFADMRASSDKAWTRWKGELLRELFERTAEVLETGAADRRRALEAVERRVLLRQEGAREELRRLGIPDATIDEFFAALPRRYFTAHTPRQIARHAQAMLAFDPERTVSVSVRAMRGGFSELIVCSRDVPGLYSRVAGALTARGINILASHVYTTRTGLALEVYRVTTPDGEPAEQARIWRAFEEVLRDVLEGRVEVDRLIDRQRRPFGKRGALSRKPPKVAISNEESEFYTIIDVSADDRLGLLYDLTRVIASHGLEIYISKAATVLDQVADTFYVKDGRGRPVTDPELLRTLERELLAAAEAGDGGTPSASGARGPGASGD